MMSYHSRATFPGRLLTAMNARGMTAEAVAARLGKRVEIVEGWLSGASELWVGRVPALSQILAVNPVWLEYGQGAMDDQLEPETAPPAEPTPPVEAKPPVEPKPAEEPKPADVEPTPEPDPPPEPEPETDDTPADPPAEAAQPAEPARAAEPQPLPHLSTLSKRLKYALSVRNMTQAALAEASNSAPGSVNSWVNNRIAPRDATIRRLAKALDVDYLWLRDGRGDAPQRDVQESESPAPSSPRPQARPRAEAPAPDPKSDRPLANLARPVAVDASTSADRAGQVTLQLIITNPTAAQIASLAEWARANQ